MTPVKVLNIFRNINSPGGGRGMPPRNFILKYTTRPDAVQPMIIDINRFRKISDRVFDNGTSDESATVALDRRLNHEGTAFTLDSLALPRDEVIRLSHLAEDMEQAGHSIREILVSFDSRYLAQEGILDDQAVNPENVQSGELFDHIDEYSLRRAIQDGMQRFADHVGMGDPQMVASIQADRTNVHAHIVLFDADSAAVNDRGYISEPNKQLIAQTVERTLDQRKEQMHFFDPLRGLKNAVLVSDADTQLKLRNLETELRQVPAYQKLADQQIPHEAAPDSPTRDYEEHVQTYDWRWEQSYLKHLGAEDPNQRLLQTIAHDIQTAPRELDAFSRRRLNVEQQRMQRRQRRAKFFNQRFHHRYQDFLIAQTQHVVAPASLAMRDWYYQERLSQRQIADKYRFNNRMAVQRHFEQNQGRLNLRQQVVADMYRRTLRQVKHPKPNRLVINYLLDNPDFKQNLLKQGQALERQRHPLWSQIGPGLQHVEQMPTYQHLRRLAHDDDFILSPLDIDTIKHATPKPKQKAIERVLTENTKVNTSQLSFNEQRIWLNYLRVKDDYEDDLWQSGGASADALDQANNFPATPTSPFNWLTPEYYQSIQDMDLPIVLADSHSNSASREHREHNLASLDQRQQALQKAEYYLQASHQKDPLAEQTRMSIDSNYRLLTNEPVNPTAETTTSTSMQNIQQERLIERQAAAQLVRKHIKMAEEVVIE